MTKIQNEFILINMLYDTHVHLEMLLSKLEIQKSSNRLLYAIFEQCPSRPLEFYKSKLLEELIKDHEFLLQSTCSTGNFEDAITTFQKIDKIKYFIGSHPEIVKIGFDLESYLINQKNLFNKHPEINNGKYNIGDKELDIVGIGEVGLDYYYTQDPELIKTQKELFQSQIELAIELNLPLMIHCRDAFEDLIPILQSYPAIHNQFLVHCFTSTSENMKAVIELGGMVAFGGVLTFKAAFEVHQSCIDCPLESLVLETDLPFLSPKRGQVCLPEHIDLVAQKIGELKNLSTDQVWEVSRQNVSRLLRF